MADHASDPSTGPTPEEAFGQVLREALRARQLSQEQLGFEAGYHRTYISFLERGQKSPSLSTIFQLALILDIAPSELIRRAEERVARVNRRQRALDE